MIAALLAALLCALIIADSVTTYIGLSRRGSREANPVMRWAIRRMGLLVALEIKAAGGTIITMLIARDGSPAAIAALTCLIALYAVTVFNNIRIIR